MPTSPNVAILFTVVPRLQLETPAYTWLSPFTTQGRPCITYVSQVGIFFEEPTRIVSIPPLLPPTPSMSPTMLWLLLLSSSDSPTIELMPFSQGRAPVTVTSLNFLLF